MSFIPDESTDKKKHDPYAALRIRDFRFFSLSRFFITLAIQMQAVIVGWQVYDITKDPLALGFIGLVEALPALTVSLYAGHLADQRSRKPIAAICMSVITLGSIALLSFTLSNGYFLHTYGIYPIYAVIFIHGIARGFMSPATVAFATEIVPKELYPNSSAWNSTVWQSAAIAGPAVGGLLYGFAGVTLTYAIIASLMFLAVISMIMIPSRPRPVTAEREPIGKSLRAGLHFVFRTQIILSALSLDLFAVLFGGAVALLPVFADRILHVGPEGLGLLRAAPSVGAVLTAVFLAHRPIANNTGRYLLMAVGGFGLCMIAFALSTNFFLSLFILAVSGAFDSVSVVIRSTALQLYTPDNMRGRVSAVNMMFIGSSNEIGAFESGVAARLLGLIPSVIFGGCMTLLTVLGISWRAPELRKLEFKNLM